MTIQILSPNNFTALIDKKNSIIGADGLIDEQINFLKIKFNQ